MPNTLEKRKYERIATERPVQIVTQSGNQTLGKMIDLSIKGTGIVASEGIETGDAVSLHFKLPSTGASDIVLEGTTAHSYSVRHEFLIGIEFQNISDYMESVIADYIRFHHRLD